MYLCTYITKGRYTLGNGFIEGVKNPGIYIYIFSSDVIQLTTLHALHSIYTLQPTLPVLEQSTKYAYALCSTSYIEYRVIYIYIG